MIDFNKTAKKWQKKWEEAKIFKVAEEPKKKKFYCLEMYPYPSEKLHMGHLRNYSIGDALARYKRMQGFNVLYPMGYDSFGLPAENAAIKHKIDPAKWTLKNIDSIQAQQKSMGLSYDWRRKISSMDPDYYKWNQWIFLKFLEKGLAYKKKSMVNWCPGCNTVLANEQVEQGKCWRCSAEVEQKELEQWFFKITEYAEELLNDLEALEWPEKVRIMQKNWIGRSEGITFKFKVKNLDIHFEMFDSIPQTFMAQTFTIIAPEHPMVKELVKGTKYEKEVLEFVEKVKKKKASGEFDIETDMEGIFTGRFIEYSPTGKLIPIWVASFVLAEYGSGVVNCSAHDERDFAFAKKYNIPLHPVMFPADEKEAQKIKSLEYCYFKDPEGILQEPEEFKGRKWGEVRQNIINFIEKNGYGKSSVNYKLRDWLISRQRYWGTPIPVVYCSKCGVVPVSYNELPVKLPKNVKFTGSGNPLETSKSFVNCKCPKCKGKARRDTDTMDTFVDSSWYFIRYCSPKFEELPFDKGAVKYWMPVDQYIGGIEHAVMHLLYARFFTKALRDLGLHNIDEPFSRLLCQGMVLKDGAKMSKSLGNVVDPAGIIEKYGADTARLFILFAALPEKELDWSEQGVEGCFRFLKRVYGLTEKSFLVGSPKKLSNKDKHIIGKTHRTIKKVTELIEGFRMSLAIGALMEYVNNLNKYTETEYNKDVYGDCIRVLALLLAPFTPHLSEEVWKVLGNKRFVSLEKWPKYDNSKIDEKAEAAEEMLHNTIADISYVLELTKTRSPKRIRLIVSDVWKYDFLKLFKKELENTRDVKDLIGVCMKDAEFRKHGKDITKLIPKYVKEPSRIPSAVLNQKTEFETLENAKKELEEEFSCKVEIEKAQDSEEQKAKQAMPGKPAILVE